MERSLPRSSMGLGLGCVSGSQNPARTNLRSGSDYLVVMDGGMWTLVSLPLCLSGLRLRMPSSLLPPASRVPGAAVTMAMRGGSGLPQHTLLPLALTRGHRMAELRLHQTGPLPPPPQSRGSRPGPISAGPQPTQMDPIQGHRCLQGAVGGEERAQGLRKCLLSHPWSRPPASEQLRCPHLMREEKQ